ncbi:uncharacterized protein LOC105437125 [Strongylocentrotus purpuratus]|uniref:Uncharacterized protein n=1 Tax=Strongylocentrotus purpuratus TaxID=7668 RepID=A0A7M7HF91_STRPU|nr:uncharacterized protein LOC105437125 [Strongylocentrotus purpuratus]|eukprot:XP_011661695.1 PREDICTED: uncharacterized protein LOC105437125 [Strongylocentrotus purpuratus]
MNDLRCGCISFWGAFIFAIYAAALCQAGQNTGPDFSSKSTTSREGDEQFRYSSLSRLSTVQASSNKEAKNHRKKHWKKVLSNNDETRSHSFSFRQPYFVPQLKRTYGRIEIAACMDNFTYDNPLIGLNRQNIVRHVKPGTRVMSRTCIDHNAPCYGICVKSGGGAICKQQYGYVMVPVQKSISRGRVEYEYDFIKYNMSCSCAIQEPIR